MGLLGAFIAEVALITYRGFADVTGPLGHLPLPANYTGAVLVYGTLGLAAKTKAAPVATALGWGFVVATLLNLWTPKEPGQLKKSTTKATSKKKVKA